MKERLRQIAFLLFFLPGHIAGWSQVSEKTYPVVGEPIPEFRLNVSYYEKKIFDPKDLKGKWIIMDFWNKTCTSCVQSFPKVNQFQEEFKDKVQFLLVAKNDQKYGKDIEEVYERYRKRLALQLPIAYDTALIQQFGVDQYPFIIIINPQSIVYAISAGNVLDRESIQDLVDNKNPTFNRVYGRLESRPPSSYKKWKYLVDENGVSQDFLYRSILSKSNGGFPIGSRNIEHDVKRGFYQVTRANLYQLYNIAWWGESNWSSKTPMYSDHWRYPVLELKDSSRFQFDYSADEGLYNYSLIVPQEKATKQHLMEVMQRDLKNYFGYEVTIERRMMPYWKLTTTEETRKDLTTRSESVEYQYGPIGMKGKRVSIGAVLFVIEMYNGDERMPFIDETKIKDRIDISFSVVMTDMDDVRKALRKHGLILEKSKKEMKVLVIRDPGPETASELTE